MPFKYIENPELEAETVAALRVKAGWDGRKDKLKKTIGTTYTNAACYDGEKLIGFIDVISDGVDDALIRNLVVHPEYQRKGIALNLLRIVIERIETDCIKTVNVLFEPQLTELYRKAGFKIINGGIIDNEEKGFDYT